MTGSSTHHPIASTRHDAGLALRVALALVLVAALVAFAADNRDSVRVGWVVGDGDAPLFVVLLVTALVGAIIGWLLLHRPHRHED